MNQLELRIFVHPGGKMPQRGKPGDAGIDVYARVDRFSVSWNEDIPQVLSEEKQIVVRQFDDAKIPLGFSYAFFADGKISHDYFLDIRNRSGVGTASGFVTTAEVGDANYRGEFHYCVVKVKKGSYAVKDGAKIAQALITPFLDPYKVDIVQVNTLEELGLTERGATGFGKSGA